MSHSGRSKEVKCRYVTEEMHLVLEENFPYNVCLRCCVMISCICYFSTNLFMFPRYMLWMGVLWQAAQGGFDAEDPVIN